MVFRPLRRPVLSAGRRPPGRWTEGHPENQTGGNPHAILRPTVLFGKEDVLINNIAWLLRRFPVFGVFGDGRYRLQPIYVDDLAELAVLHGELEGSSLVDAVGLETFTYRDLVGAVGEAVGKRRPIIGMPPTLGFAIGRLVGGIVGDVVITREEIAGLMQDLLVTTSPPAGGTRLTDWMAQNADALGRSYSSELTRRYNRVRFSGSEGAKRADVQ